MPLLSLSLFTINTAPHTSPGILSVAATAFRTLASLNPPTKLAQRNARDMETGHNKTSPQAALNLRYLFQRGRTSINFEKVVAAPGHHVALRRLKAKAFRDHTMNWFLVIFMGLHHLLEACLQGANPSLWNLWLSPLSTGALFTK